MIYMKKILLAAFILTGFVACHFPKPRKMELKEDFQKVQADLRSPEQFENVSLGTNSSTTNGNTVNSLNITRTNAKDPIEAADGRNIALQKAKILYAALKDPDDFTSINVSIVRETTGVVSTNRQLSFSFYMRELGAPASDSVPADSLSKDSILP